MFKRNVSPQPPVRELVWCEHAKRILKPASPIVTSVGAIITTKLSQLEAHHPAFSRARAVPSVGTSDIVSAGAGHLILDNEDWLEGQNDFLERTVVMSQLPWEVWSSDREWGAKSAQSDSHTSICDHVTMTNALPEISQIKNWDLLNKGLPFFEGKTCWMVRATGNGNNNDYVDMFVNIMTIMMKLMGVDYSLLCGMAKMNSWWWWWWWW